MHPHALMRATCWVLPPSWRLGPPLGATDPLCSHMVHAVRARTPWGFSTRVTVRFRTGKVVSANELGFASHPRLRPPSGSQGCAPIEREGAQPLACERRGLRYIAPASGGVCVNVCEDVSPDGAVGKRRQVHKPTGGSLGEYRCDEVIRPKHLLVVHPLRGSVFPKVIKQRPNNWSAAVRSVDELLHDVRPELLTHPHHTHNGR
eukprot:CAMPEP_0181174962 /NCGR_PEP_ID=MMETSP1096-20121128/3823_1 /TAXON_ID=156174 ORGANISM="Chrysochromulina ericina, Strain CCMP281" /NCGR_SAMPLE_ID=MMETSP1096 /ASSEMBLY_ACC=CAM_ASM_000453 /LENGTH=203 /DNA_ID=CAMNT_0023262913 /DNA_START=165 /DNA_END=772 /DNA_ORIENTATION=+